MISLANPSLFCTQACDELNLSPLSGALAVNYLDRFLGRCSVPLAQTWPLQLTAVACLSVAAKMEVRRPGGPGFLGFRIPPVSPRLAALYCPFLLVLPLTDRPALRLPPPQESSPPTFDDLLDLPDLAPDPLPGNPAAPPGLASSDSGSESEVSVPDLLAPLIRRMEVTVLGALEWKTNAVTPLSLLDRLLVACGLVGPGIAPCPHLRPYCRMLLFYSSYGEH